MNLMLIALALCPLFVSNSVFFPFISGKILFIRGVIAIVSILFASLLIVSQQFRDQISERIRSIKRNGIFIAAGAYFSMLILSTLFAANKFWAFFGTIERGEGFLGLAFFFGFFLFSALLFQKKEWVWFFKISLLVSLILSAHSFIQFFQGVERPSSFLGNPIFLAAYFLFTIFSAAIVYFRSSPNLFWKIFSATAAFAGLIGIFITETRGAIIGLIAGLIAMLAYLAIYGEQIRFKKFNLRKISVALFVCMILFAGVFGLTRKSSFWQSIPGLDRLARFSLSDATTQSRLIAAKASIKAVNPKENGWKKLLIGWGPDNYWLAWNKYYDPQFYLYESGTFDRAHNKIIDVLVMTGLLGLLAYLSIWFFTFRLIFLRGDLLPERAAAAFFGASYFVQNLFAFDSITTYVLFFGFLSYVMFLSRRDNSQS